MENSDNLRALTTKIGRVLASKPECFITHPAELRVLHALTLEQLRQFARDHGWRSVRRLGGKQIEFYNDVTVREEQSGRYE